VPRLKQCAAITAAALLGLQLRHYSINCNHLILLFFARHKLDTYVSITEIKGFVLTWCAQATCSRAGSKTPTQMATPIRAQQQLPVVRSVVIFLRL
jgi:hypothetical protein